MAHRRSGAMLPTRTSGDRDGLAVLGDLHQDPVTWTPWQRMTSPSGITAEVRHAPVPWDGEWLPLRRAQLRIGHTQEVLVGELGVDPARFADLVESQVLW